MDSPGIGVIDVNRCWEISSPEMHAQNFKKGEASWEVIFVTNWTPSGNCDKEYLFATLRIIGPSNRGVSLTPVFAWFFKIPKPPVTWDPGWFLGKCKCHVNNYGKGFRECYCRCLAWNIWNLGVRDTEILEFPRKWLSIVSKLVYNPFYVTYNLHIESIYSGLFTYVFLRKNQRKLWLNIQRSHGS